MKRLVVAVTVLVAVLVVVAGALYGRQRWLEREQAQLREADDRRAPVGRQPAGTSALAGAPKPAPSCISGVVVEGERGVAGVQVSASEPVPLTPPGSPCEKGYACLAALGWLFDSLAAGRGPVDAVKSAVTDDQGRFQLCELGPGGPRVVWGETVDGRLATAASRSTGATGEPGGPPVLLRLRALELVSGRVITELRQPVPAAQVLLVPYPDVRSVPVTAGPDGRFSARVPAGELWALARAPGFDPSRAGGRTGEFLEVELNLPRRLVVEVVHQGRPVPGAEVVLGKDERRTTGADGLATYQRVTAAFLRLRASTGALYGELTANAEPGEERRVSLSLGPAATLVGQVVDEAGAPLAGAQVSAGGADATAGADGRFRLGPTAAARHSLRAEREGCDADPTTVQAEPGENPVRLAMVCAQTLTGVVVDPAGAPVAGATLTARRLKGEGASHPTAANAAGEFTLRLAPGPYELDADHPEFRPSSRQVQVPAKGLRVVLDAGASVSGRVLDPDGKPLGAVRVRVIPALLTDFSAESTERQVFEPALTDDAGRFTVAGLRAGRVLVMAEDERWGLAASEGFSLEGGTRRDGVEVRFRRGRTLEGVVLDEAGEGVRGASVTWEPGSTGGISSLLKTLLSGDVGSLLEAMPASVSTDEAGRFVLENVPQGPVKVVATALGQRAEATATAGDRVTLKLTRRQVSALGRVVDASGAPVPRFAVNGASYSAPDGRFRLRLGVPPQALTLTFSAEGYARLDRPVDAAAADADLGDVGLKRGAALEVTVVCAERAPVTGASVSVKQAGLQLGSACTTGAKGICTMDGLEPGAVAVEVSAKGSALRSVEHQLAPEGGALEVVLQRAAGSIQGRVRVSSGAPLGARVELVAPAFDSARADEAGAFSFTGVPSGRALLSLDEWSLTWWRTVEVGAGPASVELGPLPDGATLELTLAAGAKAPPRAALLLLGGAPPASPDAVRSPPPASLVAAAQAVHVEALGWPVVVKGLAPGTWTVSSDAEAEGTVATQAVTLGAGQRQTVQLPSGPGTLPF